MKERREKGRRAEGGIGRRKRKENETEEYLDAVGSSNGVLHRANGEGFGNGLVDLNQRLLEEIAILGDLDGLRGGSQDTNTISKKGGSESIEKE